MKQFSTVNNFTKSLQILSLILALGIFPAVIHAKEVTITVPDVSGSIILTLTQPNPAMSRYPLYEFILDITRPPIETIISSKHHIITPGERSHTKAMLSPNQMHSNTTPQNQVNIYQTTISGYLLASLSAKIAPANQTDYHVIIQVNGTQMTFDDAFTGFKPITGGKGYEFIFDMDKYCQAK